MASGKLEKSSQKVRVLLHKKIPGKKCGRVSRFLFKKSLKKGVF
jgi:hypothetical protein